MELKDITARVIKEEVLCLSVMLMVKNPTVSYLLFQKYKFKSMLKFKEIFRKNCHSICVASRACLVVWMDCFLTSTD